VAPGTYQFVDADVRMQLVREGRLAVTFQSGGRLISLTYVVLPAGVEQIITAERERRRELYERFSGATLDSNAYGVIEFAEGPRFDWSGFDRLVPEVLPQGTGSSGSVDFRYHLEAPLHSRFDGSITLRFDAGYEATFLYVEEPAGFRFVFASRADRATMTVPATALTGWVLFFEKV
jgi:hypothetical protein